MLSNSTLEQLQYLSRSVKTRKIITDEAILKILDDPDELPIFKGKIGDWLMAQCRELCTQKYEESNNNNSNSNNNSNNKVIGRYTTELEQRQKEGKAVHRLMKGKAFLLRKARMTGILDHQPSHNETHSENFNITHKSLTSQNNRIAYNSMSNQEKLVNIELLLTIIKDGIINLFTVAKTDAHITETARTYLRKLRTDSKDIESVAIGIMKALKEKDLLIQLHSQIRNLKLKKASNKNTQTSILANQLISDCIDILSAFFTTDKNVTPYLEAETKEKGNIIKIYFLKKLDETQA